MAKALILTVLMALGSGNAQLFEDSGALRRVDRALYDLDAAIHRSCDPELADKAEDALAKLESAANELAKRPPDAQAAAGSLEGAIGDLEAAVHDHCFDPATGIGLMDDLAAISRALATRSLDAGWSYGGDGDEIRQAHSDLARGDALRSAGRRGRLAAFKEAANKYKDALSKAEGAIQ